jgi:formylglycine-generating enzyme required for sulfatase activity
MTQRFRNTINSIVVATALWSCQQVETSKDSVASEDKMDSMASCGAPQSRAAALLKNKAGAEPMIFLSNGVRIPASTDTTGWPVKPWPRNMVWIAGGKFRMGGVGEESRPDEFPVHEVAVDGFWMDQTEVTNAEFKQFVQEKKFVTTAEVKPDWEELKKQLPPGTPKPDESLLVPGALVFTLTTGPVDLHDNSRWWRWEPGVNWKHPNGVSEDIFSTTKFDQFPVVQVSWFDANAYSSGLGKRLPTEAEWEFAARGGKEGEIYGWGNDEPNNTNIKANIWQGQFPYKNTREDGFVFTAPVASYQSNAYGLYDMMGNVWEWCNDWYRPDVYNLQEQEGLSKNPKGPSESFDPQDPYVPKRVVRGGSFLCNKSYCASYRPSARMKTSPDSGESHTGFRCVMSDGEWREVLKKGKRA